MNKLAKTIQIFLPDGEPAGIRIAEFTMSILKIFDVPRNKLNTFFAYPESSQVGLYFLIGEDDENDEKIVYIGQSEDIKSRINNDHNKKEFWNRVIVVTSSSKNLTKTHALYLEFLAISETKAAERYQLKNGNAGSSPYAPEPLKADCHILFDSITTLLSTLGYLIFKPLVAKITEDEMLFYCTRNKVNAKGILTDEGFVVLKDSIGKKDIVYLRVEIARNKLLANGSIIIEDEQLRFVKDTLFKTPSGASSALLGRSSNGWVDWKNESGVTLDEAKRIV